MGWCVRVIGGGGECWRAGACVLGSRVRVVLLVCVQMCVCWREGRDGDGVAAAPLAEDAVLALRRQRDSGQLDGPGCCLRLLHTNCIGANHEEGRPPCPFPLLTISRAPVFMSGAGMSS